MAKFVRRFKKRSMKKRRFSRKRRGSRRSAMPRYDGMVRVKLQATKEIIVAGGSGGAAFTVSWGNQITPATAGTIVPQDCPELVRYGALYQQFSIAGVKMQFKPYKFNSGTTDIASEELLVGSSAVGLALNTTTVRLAVDFNVRNAS